MSITAQSSSLFPMEKPPINSLFFFFNVTLPIKHFFAQSYVRSISNSLHRYSIQGMHRARTEAEEVNSAKFITPEKAEGDRAETDKAPRIFSAVLGCSSWL